MAESLPCPSCGAPNEGGRKFCGECGSALAQSCPSCGAANASTVKFCGECGTALATAPAATAQPPASTPAAERRLVSVLFADLVGFTAASEQRDAEDVRELLSRYFDTSRRLIELYGGTVEKFIGDAVMAVWGTPVAQEDDAERAVRAALELVDAIPILDPSLALRAGVVTGEAVVTVGAEGQGMVAGDLVNTASRVQGAGKPGTVLVGEATRRATEAAIAYEDAGAHELKGKAEPLPLWTALRVVANRGGDGRSAGLEAPFVGRDREFRLVKDVFQGTAGEGKAHLVLVTGIAGIGKSRLAWEFEKYVDGLVASVWWHRGRCPAYGEGVAYWALAEMVRSRAGILENEDSESAAAKLEAALEQHISDADDRHWVEPRLRHLLALEEGVSHERDDLFAAWRFFFESLADTGPTVLVFEDLQWADAGLLDFVEYLLDWARSKPIFIIGLARPELTEKRPGFGSASRRMTGLALEPLAPEAMATLLEGLVPGLPEELRAAISERAEGVPLYAVETVRMLLDRGRLEAVDGSYRVVGDVDSLAVPETLHALVASRLDELTPEERRLVQDAAVLGKTFVLAALEAVSGSPLSAHEAVLQSLVRKEVLFLEADRRSPEQGQYGFHQDLVRHVAYETLSRRDRKARHLAAAVFFE
ncbi:MAG: AAA family ATPase, partial [Actinobacteria bacterium]|nr:AAA family ATPase [Actinomycetota bacterium]